MRRTASRPETTWLAAALLAAVLAPLPAAAEDELDEHRRATVPFGATPAVDGAIGMGEWDDAMEMALSEGARAWLKHDGESLYLGLRAKPQSTGNVCVVYGSEIHLLRSAEGLGTAVYTSEGSGWTTTSKFESKLRQTGTNKPVQFLRKQFFEAHGWLASNNRTGIPTDMEYRISLGMTGLDAPRIAITYTRFDEDAVVTDSWPHDLDDGCNSMRVLRGGAPKSLALDPTRWGLLSLE